MSALQSYHGSDVMEGPDLERSMDDPVHGPIRINSQKNAPWAIINKGDRTNDPYNSDDSEDDQAQVSNATSNTTRCQMGSTEGTVTAATDEKEYQSIMAAHKEEDSKDVAGSDHDLDEGGSYVDTTASDFPPGQDSPEFVPIGTAGVASAAQGNESGLSSELRGRIVVAERDAHLNDLSLSKRMTYPMIHRKYPNWGVSEQRLRGLSRNTRLKEENRPRIVKWALAAISELRHAIPMNTNRKGKIAWEAVKAQIFKKTGHAYGLLQIQAKWEHLKTLTPASMHVCDPVQPVKIIRARAQQAKTKALVDGV